MKNKKVLIILLSIIIILIVGVIIIIILNKKEETNLKLKINDINNISVTKRLDISISNINKDELGYNIKINIKNNSEEEILDKSLLLNLKDKNGKIITKMNVNINNSLKPNESFSTEYMTDEDLSDVSIIDYELID